MLFLTHCAFDLQGRAEVNNVAPSRRKPSSQYDTPEGSSEEDHDQNPSEDEAQSSDADSVETVKVHEVTN